MTFLVTGAAGNLGALAVEALLDRGVAPGDIVATARDTDRLSAFAARGVVTRRLDYDDPASVEAALEGVDRLLLVSSSAVGQRVAQHRTVLEAAAREGRRAGRLHQHPAGGLHLVGPRRRALRDRAGPRRARPSARAAPQRLVPRELHRPGPRPPRAQQRARRRRHGPDQRRRPRRLRRGGRRRPARRRQRRQGPRAGRRRVVHDGRLRRHARRARRTGGRLRRPAPGRVRHRARVRPACPRPSPRSWPTATAASPPAICYDDSGTLSALIGRPTTPLADVVKAALV